jgi:hypothetical protein
MVEKKKFSDIVENEAERESECKAKNTVLCHTEVKKRNRDE